MQGLALLPHSRKVLGSNLAENCEVCESPLYLSTLISSHCPKKCKLGLMATLNYACL